jgi:hypothetical protein
LVLKKLGKQLTEEGLNAIMTEIDIDGGGDVDFEEFFGWFVSVEAFLICVKSRITHNESTPHDRWQCDESGAAAGVASVSSTRMAKRWCVVVHVDGNGLARRLRPTHPPAPLTWIIRSPSVVLLPPPAQLGGFMVPPGARGRGTPTKKGAMR